MAGRFKELSGFRSSTSTELTVPKVTAHEAKLMDITNSLMKTSEKGEMNRKALHEASG